MLPLGLVSQELATGGTVLATGPTGLATGAAGALRISSGLRLRGSHTITESSPATLHH